MKLRFLKKTDHPKAGQLPYTPGQIIDAEKDDRNVLRWIKDHQAEVVPEEPAPETLPAEGEGTVPPTDETTPPAEPKE